MWFTKNSKHNSKYNSKYHYYTNIVSIIIRTTIFDENCYFKAAITFQMSITESRNFVI